MMAIIDMFYAITILSWLFIYLISRKWDVSY